jgi:hypothetical protein
MQVSGQHQCLCDADQMFVNLPGLPSHREDVRVGAILILLAAERVPGAC